MTKRLYGAELAAEIEKEKQNTIAAMDNRDKRIGNWETDEDDCFMSIRVEEQNIAKCNLELEILRTDGLMDYEAIFDENDCEVRIHWFPNKWGRMTCVARGIFANSVNALLKKTGWTRKVIRVPVWVGFSAGCGGGMCAVYTGRYTRTRWHTNMVTGEYYGYPDDDDGGKR